MTCLRHYNNLAKTRMRINTDGYHVTMMYSRAILGTKTILSSQSSFFFESKGLY